MKHTDHNSASASMNLEPEKLKSFLISHLNKIYCAKAHLLERLPEIHDQSYFAHLKHAIGETLEDVSRQIARMGEIYALLNEEPSVGDCSGLIGMVEDSYTAIYEHNNDPQLRDLSILFYMQNIGSVERASFQILQIVAVIFKNRHIKQLLLENFDEAKADRALLLLITTNYVTN